MAHIVQRVGVVRNTAFVVAIAACGVAACQARAPGSHDHHVDRRDVAAVAESASSAPVTAQLGAPGSPHITLGMPTPVTPVTDPDDAFVMMRSQYVVSYNRHRGGPNWVAWRLQSADYGGAARHAGHFVTDDSLPSGWYRVTHDDYTRSGFDRGHMADSADRTHDDRDNAATFLLTNVLPQRHDLNGGPWLGLEDACRVLAKHDGRVVYVVAGPIYGASVDTIARGHVAVPTSFWKVAVVLAPGQGAADVTATTPVMAAVMPNHDGIAHEKWTRYRVTMGAAEWQAGWRLLGNVGATARAALEAK